MRMLIRIDIWCPLQMRLARDTAAGLGDNAPEAAPQRAAAVPVPWPGLERRSGVRTKPSRSGPARQARWRLALDLLRVLDWRSALDIQPTHRFLVEIVVGLKAG